MAPASPFCQPVHFHFFFLPFPLSLSPSFSLSFPFVPGCTRDTILRGPSMGALSREGRKNRFPLHTVTRGTRTLGRAGKGGSTQVVRTAKHVVPPRPDAPRKYFLSPAIYDSMIPRSSRKRRVISLLSRTDKQPARCNSYNTIVRVDDQVSLPGRSWMVEEAVLRSCTRVCV